MLASLLLALCAAQDGPPLGPVRTLDTPAPFAPPATLEAWRERRERVRRRVLVAAGLWPEPERAEAPPPRLHGPVERDGYTVWKLSFESLPGFHVTANLYRPDGDGPFPAVLSPHGHWTDGRFSVISDDEVAAQLERGEEEHEANARFHLQARCATLARAGCVVLHHDMVGYADSRQLPHAEGFGDVEAELWGLSAFGLQTWNSLRALDVLLAQPGVDPERVAVTGASGGGTQTFVLGAIDERPAVLFPAVMVSTGMQGGCVCENASHLRVGTGNVELAALAAPRPLGLTGADDWTREVETKGGPELRALYALYGASERLGVWCEPAHPHNFNAVARGRLYDWLEEHLGVDLPGREPLLVPVEPERLRVYDEEHPRPTAGLPEVRAVLLERARKARQRLRRDARDDLDGFRRKVGGALETMIAPRALPAPAAELREALAERGFVRVRGTGDAAAPLAGAAEARTARGGPVLVRTTRDLELPTWSRREVRLEALLTSDGDPAALPVDAGRHGRFVGYTLGYNRTLLAERVGELLAAIDLAATAGEVALVGGPESSPWVALAAALSDAPVARVALELDWDFADVTSLEDPDFLPGAERWGGRDAYLALLAPTPLLLLGADAVPEVVRDAYAAAGAPEAVRVSPVVDPAALERWLVGHAE